jgi:hypothetical protein
VSPVAWSSFSTGTQPGRHNIFDFIDRDRRTHPARADGRTWTRHQLFKIGRYRIPRNGRSCACCGSRGRSVVLGEHRIWSTILRVPITFPPDRFYGAELSAAMSVPDLLGTAGHIPAVHDAPVRRAIHRGRHASRRGPQRAIASRRGWKGRRTRSRLTAGRCTCR